MSGSPLPSHRHTETEKVRSKPTIAAVLLVTKRCMRKIKACTFYETILTTSLLTYLSNTFNIDFLRGEKIFKKFNEKFVAYIKIVRKTAACLRWGEITEKMIADTNYCLRGERDSGRDPRGRPSLSSSSVIVYYRWQESDSGLQSVLLKQSNRWDERITWRAWLHESLGGILMSSCPTSATRNISSSSSSLVITVSVSHGEMHNWNLHYLKYKFEIQFFISKDVLKV